MTSLPNKNTNSKSKTKESSLINKFNLKINVENEIVLFPYETIIDFLLKYHEGFREKAQTEKFLNVKSEDLSGDGYTSSIIRTLITFSDSTTQSFVVKLFDISKLERLVKSLITNVNDSEMEKTLEKFKPKFSRIHNNECNFYTAFSSRNILPLPKIFHSELLVQKFNNGVIIMEDLTYKASIHSISDGFNAEHARELADYFAEFHATMLCDDKTADWKLLISNELLFENEEKNYLNDMKNSIFKFDPSFKDIIARLEKTVSSTFVKYCKNEIPKLFEFPIFVSHGDLWCNNLLWLKDSNNKPTSKLSAIIDWQLNHKGNFLMDFGRLFATSFDCEIRREVENWFFDYYYEKLSKKLAEKNRKIEFKLENIKDAYELTKTSQSCVSCLMIPILGKTYESKFSKEVANEKINKFVKRIKAFCEECITILEKKAPEWLTHESEVKL